MSIVNAIEKSSIPGLTRECGKHHLSSRKKEHQTSRRNNSAEKCRSKFVFSALHKETILCLSVSGGAQNSYSVYCVRSVSDRPLKTGQAAGRPHRQRLTAVHSAPAEPFSKKTLLRPQNGAEETPCAEYLLRRQNRNLPLKSRKVQQQSRIFIFGSADTGTPLTCGDSSLPHNRGISLSSR